MCMVTFDPRRYIWLISLINVDILFWCLMEWLCQHVQYAQHVREDTAMCGMQEAQQVFQCSSNTSACVKLNSYLNSRMYDIRFLQRAKHRTVPGESTHQHKPEPICSVFSGLSVQVVCLLGNDREGTRGLEMCRSYSWQLPQGIVATAPAALGLHFPQLWGLKLGNLSLQVFSDLPTCG